jgi:hypothetical protein
MQCKHCNKIFNESKGWFANHVRWCDSNPKSQQFRKDNIERGKKLGKLRFGEYKRFEVSCFSCNSAFQIKERELLFPSKEKYFCSRNCANSIGGKAKSEKYHSDNTAHYTTIAWRHHDKKCVVCGEDKIVAVHHYNENHNDNDPKNLIPLCPTHHQYMHSRYKSEIVDIVNEYIKNKWGDGTAWGGRLACTEDIQ